MNLQQSLGPSIDSINALSSSSMLRLIFKSLSRGLIRPLLGIVLGGGDRFGEYMPKKTRYLLIVHESWPNLSAEQHGGYLESQYHNIGSSQIESYLAIVINIVEPKVNRVASNTVYSTIRFSVSLAMLMEHGYRISTKILTTKENSPIRAITCAGPQHETRDFPGQHLNPSFLALRTTSFTAILSCSS